MRKKKFVKARKKPKHATLAEGFAAAAKDHQLKTDLYDKIAERLKP